MDSSSASISSPDMLDESPHNYVQEEVLSSKEIIDQIQSNEGVDNPESSLSEPIRASPPPRMSGSSENPPPPPPRPVDEQVERDYGCRYCEKFFSNKQALGGHMNAHKRERTIEKNILDQMANSAYPPRNNLPSSLFNRSHEDFDRAMMNMPYIAQQYTTQHAMMRYGRAPRPLPGINKGTYPGWPMPVPGNVPQFMARRESSRLENYPPGINFPTPTSVPNRKFLGESSNKQINGRETQGFEDDSSLDLTLRL